MLRDGRRNRNGDVDLQDLLEGVNAAGLKVEGGAFQTLGKVPSYLFHNNRVRGHRKYFFVIYRIQVPSVFWLLD